MIRIREYQRSKEMRKRAYRERVKWASKLIREVKPEGKVTGVEIGLWKADFALGMLQKDEELHWYGVDPYFEYGKGARKQPMWNAIFEKVTKKMAPYNDRFTLIRKPSAEGVKYIPEKVEFVFVDGNHNEEFVWEDLCLYEPHVKKGGIMSGHDYYHRVAKAVDEYASEHERDIQVDIDFDPHGVFWWRVP
jgi:hypothetical protein